MAELNRQLAEMLWKHSTVEVTRWHPNIDIKPKVQLLGFLDIVVAVAAIGLSAKFRGLEAKILKGQPYLDMKSEPVYTKDAAGRKIPVDGSGNILQPNQITMDWIHNPKFQIDTDTKSGRQKYVPHFFPFNAETRIVWTTRVFNDPRIAQIRTQVEQHVARHLQNVAASAPPVASAPTPGGPALDTPFTAAPSPVSAGPLFGAPETPAYAAPMAAAAPAPSPEISLDLNLAGDTSFFDEDPMAAFQ